MPANKDRIDLLGCPVDPLTLDEAVKRVEAYLQAGDRLRRSIGINLDQLLKINRDPAFRSVVCSADMLTADGQPVVWLSRWLANPVPERVASIDLMEALLPVAAERGYRVFLLGTKPMLLQRAADCYARRHPGIRIVGMHHGFFTRGEEPAVVASINAVQPDILLIAMSSPQKEWFVERHRDALNVGFVLGVGGAFDIAAGEFTRAPRWMRRGGLEWVWRWAHEPWRMAPRILSTAGLIPYLVPALWRRVMGVTGRRVATEAADSSSTADHTASSRGSTRSIP